MAPFDLIEGLKSYEADLVGIRRDLHRHPETGFEEARTAAVVAAKLREYGLEVTEGVAQTGVVGTLRGGGSGNRAIGLRADMDALHIQENAGRDYRSTIAGKMHACGHDGHTTMLLGAARYLANHRDSFAGTVHFVFQPAEEGLGGGEVMVKEGLFDRFPMDAIYGMHNMPGIPVGEFHTRTGPFLAASDSWSVVFHGTGGHGGAGAHLATDVTLAAAHFITALQTIVSRNVPARESAVISVGSIKAGDPNAANIMPASLFINGTARSYAPAVRDLLEQRLKEIAHAQAGVFGCSAEPTYTRRYPPLVTHAEQTAIAARAAAALVGEHKVETNAPPISGSEDFAFMLNARPGGFVFIGNGPGAPVHTPDYDFNDDILTLGAAYWVQLVRTELPA
jgi:amidohydrolase